MYTLSLEPKYIALSALFSVFAFSPAMAGFLALLGGVGHVMYHDERIFNLVGNTLMTLSWYALKISAHIEVWCKWASNVLSVSGMVNPYMGDFLDKDTMYGSRSTSSPHSSSHSSPITYDIVSVDDTLTANTLSEYQSMVETESICNPTFKRDYVAFIKQMGRVGTFGVDDVKASSVCSRLRAIAPDTPCNKWIACELRYHVDGEDAPSIKHSVDVRDTDRYVALSGNELFTPQFFRWYGIDAGIVAPADWKRITKCTAAVIDGNISTHEYSYDVLGGDSVSCTLE